MFSKTTHLTSFKFIIQIYRKSIFRTSFKSILIPFIISLLFYLPLNAQNNTLNKFTYADTLRGTLSPFRTCYDVKFYDLNITVKPDQKLVEGYNAITFKANQDFQKFQIDLFSNMVIRSIEFRGQKLKYVREFNAVIVSFPSTLYKDSLYRINVNYEGNPQIAKNPPWDGGFTWTVDDNHKTWVGVSCQGTGASLWWPNKDHQSDEPDSMHINIAVPKGLQDISNGRLVRYKDLGNGYTEYDWKVINPINNYDVTLNIGDYVHFGEKLNDLTCDYYVLSNHLEIAKKQFSQVKPMLECFQKYFGPYPFPEDGFKLVETPYLGMEHQSAVAYGNHFQNGYKGFDWSGTGIGLTWDYIIVHESAHEWFGNNITTNDMADMWVHEAFATYAESLFVECTQGYNKGQDYLFGERTQIKNKTPCIAPYGVNQEGSEDMYFKGANMLNTVRHILQNDSLWFSILKGLNVEFRHKTVDGEDVIEYICKRANLKNLDLKPIFYQYLKTTQVPELKLEWVGKNKIRFKWNAETSGFAMPVDLILHNQNKLRIYPNKVDWTTLPLETRQTNSKAATDLHGDTHSFYFKIAPNKSE